MTETYPDIASEIAARVDAYMTQFIDAYELPSNLRDAIRYSALGGGKRLRPVLTLLSCRAVGGDESLALPPAAALEFIHAFSLVHDDLPAMDDDDMRRGRPTLHVHAGEAMAILAGDAMTSLAFAMIHGDTRLQPTLAHLLSRELAAATTDMIAGQVYDTLGGFAPALSDTEKLHTIHRNKTGALIRAAFRMGAICGQADDHRLAQLTQLGEITGLMFQIVDDLLDVTQSSEHLGKAAGKDAQAGKHTFPGLLGIQQSKDEVQRLHQAAMEILQDLGEPAIPLREVCEYLAVRTR